YKIPVIENLGATLDQFDTIDFSDNDIRKLDGFPLLKRLKTLMLNNNRIVRLADGLGSSIPNLESLILSGNNLQELSDIDPLISLQKLTTLSLLENPIVTKPHYRLYVAFKLPNLRLLDFRKIKQKEREEAMLLFKSKHGRQLQREIATKGKTFVPGGNLPKEVKKTGPSKEDVAKIRAAIAKASSLEEVEKLNRMLQSGSFTLKEKKAANGTTAGGNEVEEDEEMDM
ncbi:hypothetical protein GE061_008440, partial [Apolygus lucorum]